MNIINEKIDELNSVLKVNIIKQDYEEGVEKTLRDYRKKINLPGFRAGKVPFELVKKKFGTAVLQEEINKIVSNSIQNYLTDNRIHVIGQPLPKAANDEPIDWQNQSEFEFLYELGLAPEIDLKKLDGKLPITELKIKINDKDIEDGLQNLRKYYAVTEAKNTVTIDSYIKGKCIQILDDNAPNNISSFSKEITFCINDLKNNELKLKFLEKAINDKIKLNIPEDFKNDFALLASVFQLNENDATKLKGNFEFEISMIFIKILPELNQDFFNKVKGKDKIESKEDLMALLKTELEVKYENYSNSRLENDLIKKVLEQCNLKLPDEFLKKWLRAINKEKETNYDVDKEYDAWSESMKWHLVQDKIVDEHKLKPTADDVRNNVQSTLKKTLFPTDESPNEDLLKSYTEYYLKDHKNKHTIEDKIINERSIAFLKSKFNIQTKNVLIDEFIKI